MQWCVTAGDVQGVFVAVPVLVVGGGHPPSAWIGSPPIAGTSHSVGSLPCLLVP